MFFFHPSFKHQLLQCQSVLLMITMSSSTLQSHNLFVKCAILLWGHHWHFLITIISACFKLRSLPSSITLWNYKCLHSVCWYCFVWWLVAICFRRYFITSYYLYTGSFNKESMTLTSYYFSFFTLHNFLLRKFMIVFVQFS